MASLCRAGRGRQVRRCCRDRVRRGQRRKILTMSEGRHTRSSGKGLFGRASIRESDMLPDTDKPHRCGATARSPSGIRRRPAAHRSLERSDHAHADGGGPGRVPAARGLAAEGSVAGRLCRGVSASSPQTLRQMIARRGAAGRAAPFTRTPDPGDVAAPSTSHLPCRILSSRIWGSLLTIRTILRCCNADCRLPEARLA